MKLVVGLGNPGTKYARTRHNVGFEVIDSLASSRRAYPGAPGLAFAKRFGSLVAELSEDSNKLVLVKPQCFMNRSGQPVREIVDFYQLPLDELLVVCDDINLPLGKLRIRPR